jgi:hypothetical protein
MADYSKRRIESLLRSLSEVDEKSAPVSEPGTGGPPPTSESATGSGRSFRTDKEAERRVLQSGATSNTVGPRGRDGNQDSRSSTSRPPSSGYGYESGFSLRESRPAPAPAKNGPSTASWVIFAVCLLAIVLWLPIGVKYLSAQTTGGIKVEQSYSQWVLDSASNTVATQLYRPAMKLQLCVDKDQSSCACAVSLPAMDAFEKEASAMGGKAGGAVTAQSALSTLIRAYEELRSTQQSVCLSGSGMTSLRTSLDRYGTAHNAFVDAIDALEKSSN